MPGIDNSRMTPSEIVAKFYSPGAALFTTLRVRRSLTKPYDGSGVAVKTAAKRVSGF